MPCGNLASCNMLVNRTAEASACTSGKQRHRRYLGATQVTATMNLQNPVSGAAARVPARRALLRLLQAYLPRCWPFAAAPCRVLHEASASLRQRSRAVGTGYWVWAPAVQRLHPATPTCAQPRSMVQPAHLTLACRWWIRQSAGRGPGNTSARTSVPPLELAPRAEAR